MEERKRSINVSQNTNLSLISFYETKFFLFCRKRNEIQFIFIPRKRLFRLVLSSPAYVDCGLPALVMATISKRRRNEASLLSSFSKVQSGAKSVYSANLKVCLFHKFEKSKRSELCLFHKLERSKRSEVCLFHKFERLKRSELGLF